MGYTTKDSNMSTFRRPGNSLKQGYLNIKRERSNSLFVKVMCIFILNNLEDCFPGKCLALSKVNLIFFGVGSIFLGDIFC